MQIIVAPIQGHTDAAYRHFHADVYTPAHEYNAPFLHIEHGAPRHRDLNDITSRLNAGLNLRPQVLFRSVEEFTLLVAAVKEAGYACVDLNLGCPFVPQIKKGRGAAMITNTDCMRKVSDIINGDPDMDYSLKMRIGLTDSHQWEALVPILNDTRLSRVTIHPRIASQLYSGTVDMDQFTRTVAQINHSIVYNGDIQTPADLNTIIDRFPTIKGVMVGRGLLARPSLIAEWSDGHDWDKAKRISTLIAFHNKLLNHYISTLCGNTQILSKIKPFWEYISPDEIDRRILKHIRKATTLASYQSAVLSAR